VDKQGPKPETLALRGDFHKFTQVMKRLVTVPYSEIKSQMDAESQARKRKREKASARVSRARS